jgi:protein involved in polysaccharide export with SLBB domain
LKFLLRPLGLTYRAEDDVILITNPPRGIDLDSRDRLGATFRGELDRARRVLENAEKQARDPADPAVARARRRVADLESAVEQFQAVLATFAGDDPGRGGAARPAGGLRDQPREFRKVVMPTYVVEPPDIISVEVLEALPGRPITGERLVRPDGRINLGYYGEVYVAGLTTSEIKEKVALHLRQYLDDKALGLSRDNPQAGKIEPVPPAQSSRVMVDVTAYNSKVYYVQGEVITPGRLNFTGNETVLDAINYAGGLLPTASKANIRLVRPAPPGAGGEQVLPVNLAAIIEAGNPATNYQIMPGDRLVVYRDPKAVPDEAGQKRPEPATPADVEARLQAVERKLDEVLKALERISKP